MAVLRNKKGFTRKRDWVQYVINKEYNAEMLASAVALHEGFVFNPDKNVFWKQSYANERSYLYVTTAYISRAFLEAISNMMTEGEYLVIACKSYEANVDKDFSCITVKKIPDMLLEKCEFNKDNYDLNIIDPPAYKEEDYDE